MSYYLAPQFLDKVAVHITKNFIDLRGVQVPLILGIHGHRGEGKSFQCELVFRRMGIEPVRMSAGELESPDAGDPVRLIRMRYREAAELIAVRGRMCVLLINDLDAGAGRFNQSTQYTVNTQLVNGTLMNIADNPTDVQLPGSYETEPIHRVPIVVTGNDFSTLYSPLVREGRMEKFYWQPSREDKIGIVSSIFEEDKLPQAEIERLIDTFPNQAVDFFSSLRSRAYDEQVRQFIRQVGIDRVSVQLVNSPDKAQKIANSNITLPQLMELGEQIEQEQTSLQSTQLAQRYTTGIPQPVPQVERTAPEKGDNGLTNRNLQSQQTSSYNYAAPAGSSGTSQSAPARGTQVGDSKLIENWPDNVSLPEVERLLESAIKQGSRLSLEVAKPREKARNIWRAWPWSQQPENATQALEGIADCINNNPGSYIKLVGYNLQTQTRTLEELIFRP